MKERKEHRSIRVFFSTLCTVLTLLLLAAGLLVADCNSRQTCEGTRAARAYATAAELLTLTETQQALLREGVQLLPARMRMIGGVWLTEYRLARFQEDDP